MSTAAPAAPADQVRKAALYLGYAGLLPFVGGALAVWLVPSPYAAFGHAMILAYGVAIASFMGGVQWGLGIKAGLEGNALFRVLGISVLPALVAWAAAMAPFPLPYLGLIMAFILVLRVDSVLTREGLAPAWYPKLRRPLTYIVVASLVIALASAGSFGR